MNMQWESIKEMKKKAEEKLWVQLMVILLFSFFMTIFILGLQPNPVRRTFELVGENWNIFWLNMIPVLLTTLLVYGISGSVRISIHINYWLYAALSVVNRTKVLYRDEPFGFGDLSLGFESVMMSVKAKYTPETKIIMAVILVYLAVIGFSFLYKAKKSDYRMRLGMTVFVLVSGFLLYQNVYANQSVFDSIKVDGNAFNEKDVYNSKGLVYSVIKYAEDNQLVIPPKYKKSEFENIKPETNEIKGVRPNVVMIMGEAFHDLSDLPVFVKESMENPIYHFRQIQKEALVYGRTVTPTFAGGTADTEFEVLTGTQAITSSPSKSYAYNGVTKERNSIVRVFDKAGYFTRGFHPGYSWFYKRQSVYPKLGFQESYFLDSIENPDMKGGNVSEQQTYDIFIEKLDEKVKEEAPVFDFMVTVQNHGPYNKEKYAEEYAFETTHPISQAMRESLSAYFIGIKDMDENLHRLHQYMKESDEPFIFVFWGDHLPGLVDSSEYYKEIDFSIGFDTYEDSQRFYSTPFFIWANEKAKEMMNLPERQEMTVSTNYLGAYTLQLLGFDKADPFYQYVNGLREKFPVLSRYYTYDGQKAQKNEKFSSVYAEDLFKYYRWQYFITSQRYKD